MNMRDQKAFLIGAITFFVIGSATAQAEDLTKCASRTDLAGPCYKVHGRLSIWDGSPPERVWIIGTKRILGVSTPYSASDLGASEQPVMPKIVSDQFRNSGTQIYADFVVCPFEKDIPGHMRNVCIESAKNILVEDNEWIDNKNRTTYIRVPDASTN